LQPFLKFLHGVGINSSKRFKSSLFRCKNIILQMLHCDELPQGWQEARPQSQNNIGGVSFLLHLGHYFSIVLMRKLIIKNTILI
jgi:hypothetical protein